MVTAEKIRKMMGRQVQGICSHIYPQERPNAVTDSLSAFIVVSLPYAFRNQTMGEDDDWWIDVTVVYDIYVKDKKSAKAPRRMDDDRLEQLREQLRATFPAVDYTLGVKIVRPRTVIPGSSDGEGYHYTRIQAKMTTMV